MKIDFLKQFPQVNRNLERPSLPKGEDGAFHRLLADIAPKSPIVSETSEAQAQPVPPPVAHNTARASIRFPPPDLQLPEIAPLVPEATPGVKTPTLVSAKRVSIALQAPLGPQGVSQEQVASLVQEAGRRHGIDPALGLAVISAESSFDHRAVSQDGHASKGLFQLLDSTGATLQERDGLSEEYDPFEPKQNIDLGVRYLRHLHDIFSVPTELPNQMTTSAAANSSSLEKLALAAFNAGEGRVASAQQRAKQRGGDPSLYEQVEPYLPEITKDYVQRVSRRVGEFAPLVETPEGEVVDGSEELAR